MGAIPKIPETNLWTKFQQLEADMREQLASQASAFNSTVAELQATVGALQTTQSQLAAAQFAMPVVTAVTVSGNGWSAATAPIVSVTVPWVAGKSKCSFMIAASGIVTATGQTATHHIQVLCSVNAATQQTGIPCFDTFAYGGDWTNASLQGALAGKIVGASIGSDFDVWLESSAGANNPAVTTANGLSKLDLTVICIFAN